MIEPQRQHDRHLNDLFFAVGYRGGELRRLNRCKMFLKINTLADATTADGRKIEPDVLAGKPLDRNSPFDWPRVHPPSHRDWEFWRAALKQAVSSPHSDNHRLTLPLGKWKQPTDDLWNWWFSQSEDRLYHRVEGIWEFWTHRPELGRRQFALSTQTVLNPPPDLLRASVSLPRNCHTAQLRHLSPAPDPLPLPEPPPSLHKILSDVPASLRWSVERCRVPQEGCTIATAIQNNEAVAVSDASLKECFGTTAYVLEGPNSINRALGVNVVPGPIKDGDSYRCELAGLIGMITLINAICKRHQISQGSVNLACDNQSTLYVFEPDFIPDPSKNSFDLVNCLWHLIKECPVCLLPEHVEGHKIDTTSRENLTRMEILNDEMDAMAKEIWKIIKQSGHSMKPPQLQVYKEGWSIWQRSTSTKLHSPHPSVLHPILADQAALDYWTKPHTVQPTPRLSQQAVRLVDWDACGEAMKQLNPGRRRWTTKNASENCGVGITQQAWKKQPHDKCPRCGLPENTDHVQQCLLEGSEERYQQDSEDLLSYFNRSNTHPAIQTAILARLQAYRHRQPLHPLHDLDPQVQQATLQQDRIGWKNFLEGLPAIAWTPIQQRHYDSLYITSTTGKRWMKLLLKRIHQLAWGQWDHRNDVLHNPTSNRNRSLPHQLETEITDEMIRGVEDLPAKDHPHFGWPLCALLNRSNKFKQAWLTNVNAARNRQARRRSDSADARAETGTRSAVLHWARTGVLPPS